MPDTNNTTTQKDGEGVSSRALLAEVSALRAIIMDSVKALGTSAVVSHDSSIEFLQSVPNEIAGTVKILRGIARNPIDHWADQEVSDELKRRGINADKGYESVQREIAAAIKSSSS